MKKKILISLVACFIAAGAIIHFNLPQNASMLDVSLADISVMAQADGESGSTYHCCPLSLCSYEPGLLCTVCSSVYPGYCWWREDHTEACGPAGTCI